MRGVDEFDGLGRAVVDIGAQDPVGREPELLRRDDVDGDPVGEQRDVGMRDGPFHQRRLDRLSGAVGDVQHATLRMPAFPRQVKSRVRAAAVEGQSVLGQAPDRVRAAFDDELHDLRVAQARTRLDRVAHMAGHGIPRMHDRGDAALGTVGRSALDAILGQHQDPRPVGDAQRRGEAGGASAHDENVGGVLPFHDSD